MTEQEQATGTATAQYSEVETFAVDLAHFAGKLIEQSLDTDIEVAYKDTANGSLPPIDAVTSADREIEHELVSRILERYPDHAVLGEEGTSIFPPGAEFVWALDPIDGTQNFVNGLPIYSSSIGVLHRGIPVAGAVWGASTHRLRPGVYHGAAGGVLRFEGEEITVARPSHGKLRGLGAMPHDEDQHLRPGETIGRDHILPWDRRHIGSGALEAAFLAAGVLDSAFNTGPRVWDIAAGALLVLVGGRGIWTLSESRWVPLQRFADSEGPALAEELSQWRHPVLMATSAAHARVVG